MGDFRASGPPLHRTPIHLACPKSPPKAHAFGQPQHWLFAYYPDFAISHFLRHIGATTPPFLPIPLSTAVMGPQHEDPTKTIVPRAGDPDHGVAARKAASTECNPCSHKMKREDLIHHCMPPPRCCSFSHYSGHPNLIHPASLPPQSSRGRNCWSNMYPPSLSAMECIIIDLHTDYGFTESRFPC